MAFRLSRVSSPLAPDKAIELGHHVLKAHIYKSVSRQLGYSSRDMQAYWMCLSSHSLSQALVAHRNVFSPNVKVSCCCCFPLPKSRSVIVCVLLSQSVPPENRGCDFLQFFCIFVQFFMFFVQFSMFFSAHHRDRRFFFNLQKNLFFLNFILKK